MVSPIMFWIENNGFNGSSEQASVLVSTETLRWFAYCFLFRDVQKEDLENYSAFISDIWFALSFV